MTLFVLNESKTIDVANALLVFKSFEDVSIYIEPIDVENSEYFIFDTNGQFYEINSTDLFDEFEYVSSNLKIDLAIKLVSDALSRRGLVYSANKSLEENARNLGVEKT
jgi:hypothetical protein